MRLPAFALAVAAAGLAGPLLAAPPRPVALASTAEEVIARNVAARGGLDAWRQVQTMVWLGHIERSGAQPGQSMRFVMQLKRPNLTRFEVKAQNEEFTRLFDGTQGWKIRPSHDGRPDTKPFSAEEVAFSREEFVLDGPLIDAAAKGVKARFAGVDALEGRRTYRLELTLPSGGVRDVWIDTQTNLEVRYDRPATNPLAPGARVSIYYRDYAAEKGLQLAHRIEVAGAKGQPVSTASDRLVIDHVLVNAALPDNAFEAPSTTRPRGTRVPLAAGAVPPGAAVTPAPPTIPP